MATESAPCVLSIDLGTSGPKVALVDAGGEIAASAASSVQTHLIPPDGAEQDLDEIWGAIRSAVQQVVEEAGRPIDRIVGVNIAAQFSSIVPVGPDGRSLMNLVLWMDGRGAPYARGIYQEHPDALTKWLDIHGVFPLPSGLDSLSHMLWVQKERPDIYERTHKFLEPVDFVTARLTGSYTANACTAFMMLLTDNRQLDAVHYDDDLIAMSGLDRDKLPDLVPILSEVGHVLPAVAEELGLAPRTPVFSGVNDTQAVAVGTGTFQQGHGGINIGTTSQVLAHVGFKRTDIEHEIVSTPSPIPGRYVALAENGLGAKTLDHFLRNVAFAGDALADHSAEDPFAQVEDVVGDVPPGSGNLLFLPWLAGSQAPSANPNARGAFLNISLDTTRAHMVRAILEGVAFSLRWLLPAVETFAEQDFDQLRFAGGAALSDQWSQILADVMDRPVLQLEDARYTINRAAAFLAFERLGLAGMDDASARDPRHLRPPVRTIRRRIRTQSPHLRRPERLESNA
jgi:xylulokinase